MSPWSVRGVSKSARELAANAARDEGLELHAWLERAIYRAVSETPAQRQPDQAILDALHDIRNQLDRIELEGGFLYRVWQRIKAQFSKPE